MRHRPRFAPAPRRGRLAALTVVLGVALVLLLRSGSGHRGLAAGDCLEVVQGGAPTAAPPGAGPMRRIGCHDPKAAYEVGVRIDGITAECPAEIYTVRRDPAGFTLCLMYNVAKGRCFLESSARTGSFNCAEGPRPGAIKILERVDGVTDPARCEGLDSPGVLVALVPAPATTFCYVDFGTGQPPAVAT